MVNGTLFVGTLRELHFGETNEFKFNSYLILILAFYIFSVFKI